MKRIASRQPRCLFIAAVVLLAAGVAVPAAYANNNKPNTSTPTKSTSTTSKPATPAPKTGGSTGTSTHTGTTTTTHGPTTTTTHGPTTTTTHGPTTTTSHGPTTGNAGGHTTTTTTGGHTNISGSTGHTGGLAPGKTATGHPAPVGSHTLATRNGAVTRRPDGHISDIHDNRRGMDIHHGLNGSRHVEVMRADHSRVYAERGRPGFVERRYNYHGHDFARRSYYWHGHEYNRFYRGYYYHGLFVNVYAPGFYFRPAFYGWAYNPWAAPVAFAWGWGAAPWYGYYGYYFTPYPVYPGPAFWLTDYIISTDLQAQYAAQQEANLQAQSAPPAGGPPALTPEVKAEIADEVKAQIALENAEAQQNAQSQDIDPASSGIARMLGDGREHVFVVASSLDVVSASGEECALSDGDVLQFAGAPVAPNAQDVQLIVAASKGGNECARTASVTVGMSDVQEMQNHMRETIDQGLQELQSKQGQGGLPAAPATALAPPAETQFAQNAPPPEPNGANDVNQQLTQADQAEQEAAQPAAPGQGAGAAPPPPPPATVNISLGQSIDQVTSQLGQPVTVVNLGSKKIYKYQDMKITFTNGKVSDVE
jgi:hypothetical protein